MAKRGGKLAAKSKKKGLSHAKASNILRNKKAKRGELTDAQKKRKKQDKKEKKLMTYAELQRRKNQELKTALVYAAEEVYPLSKEVTGEEMLSMMDSEDLDVLRDYEGRKRNKKTSETEETYEEEERSFDKNPLDKNLKSLLPIKTPDGIIPQYTEVKDGEEKNAEEEDSNKLIPTSPKSLNEIMRRLTRSSGDPANLRQNLPGQEEENIDPKNPESFTDVISLSRSSVNEHEHPKNKGPKSAVDFMIERQEKLDEKKTNIGCLASNFLQDPQNRISGLLTLVRMMDEQDPDISITIKKYAALSLLEVFHNIIPAYHIQQHDLNEKLKKETRNLYRFENHMLAAYQTYLRNLENMMRETKKKTNSSLKKMAAVALRCMGELLTKHIHFNFSSNLITAIVPYLNHEDDELCFLASSYVTMIFKVDRRGEISLEIVRRIDSFVRKRAFTVRPEVLKVFMKLRIKNVESLDAEMEAKLNAKRKLTHKEKLIRKLTEKQQHKKSHKEAKLFRKKRKLEEQMKGIKKERMTKDRNQQHSGILQLVFGLYFHVLKRRPNQKLNGVVLEGLARFAHLINIEFFADLLNVLGDLMAEGTLQFQESLHCIQVVFTILSDQGEVLSLDPQRFYKYLYNNMLKVSADSNTGDIVTVVESLNQMLLMWRKRASVVRVQAFTKRLATLCLTLLHNGAVAALATLRSVVLHHPSVEVLLETDSEGGTGVFSAEVEEPEHSNAATATLWELHPLTRHYHSTVQQMSRHILCGAPIQGNNTLSYTLTKRSSADLYSFYDPSEMKFNPAIPAPEQHLNKRFGPQAKKNAKKHKANHWTTEYMAQEVSSLAITGESVLVNGLPSGYMNGQPKNTDNVLSKSNGLNGLAENNTALRRKKQSDKSNIETNLECANIFSGMLANMDIEKILVRELPDCECWEEVTLKLVKVESKTVESKT